ncbi:MAG: RagB/SusD family nutrient uptake outer membrane protein, partial [Pedobacter sp.]
MRKYILTGILALTVVLMLNSCKKYLDVVPDNIATIDNAFTMRTQAEKFLFTCFSYMPKDANMSGNPALGGDEIWRLQTDNSETFAISRNLQNVVNPMGNGYWDGLYQGLRDCNIFLENVGKVPDLSDGERARWIAEVKFLKAYYHYYLVRMYGPIPLIKTNLPIDADVNEVKVFRDPVDSCFNYISSLLDEAAAGLPKTVISPATEAGRVTQPIALS